MKVFLKFVLPLVVILAIIGVGFYARGEKVTNIEQKSMEFGTSKVSDEEEYSYVLYHINYSSDSNTLDESVNKYVQDLVTEFKAKNTTDSFMLERDRAVFIQNIDTYKVNNNIVSAKVTTKIKNIKEDNYKTEVKCFNIRLDNDTNITLDDLFNDGYKEEISSLYTDNYLLTKDAIYFYDNNSSESSVKYNYLKNYCKTKMLDASNLGVTEDEYKELTGGVIDKNKKMVAITFDDGLHATNTEKVLDILSKYNAHATFFMLGQNVEQNKEVVKDVQSNGHEIGVHTWDHKQLTKLSETEIESEVYNTRNLIESITGVKPKLVRPPYGSFNDTVKNAITDMPLILWDIDSLDWKSRDPEKIVPLVEESVQDGDIILLHDIHSTTVDSVEPIVKYLSNNGYQMVTVSQMLEAKGYDTSKTRVFYSGRQ